ncbi:MAG: alpha/beta fold hydrolase [Desulfovibrionales bacterium]|nr:alpha/beta fold hydrolase [Desulfovibrionales bacterium]
MTASILITLFGIPLLMALLTYTLYCYEETNSTGRPLPFYLNLSLRTVLHSILSEILILLLYPLGLRRSLWVRPSQGKALVVLVHGLFHNQGAWILCRRWLHRRGFATSCFSYASWKSDWEQTTSELEKYLRVVMAEDPSRDVHLVGHSMGGLLLRAVLAGMEVPRQVRTLTTWGTPFGGSKLTPFALNSLGRYLRHNGELVRKLGGLPFPPHVKSLAIRSPADNMVLPNTALRCNVPGWMEHESSPVSHVAMLHSREVFTVTLDWIDRHTGDVETP